MVIPCLTILALLSSFVFIADLAMPFSGLVQVDRSIFDRIRVSISHVLSDVNTVSCRPTPPAPPAPARSATLKLDAGCA